jgi:hypothetical protein
MAKTDLTQVTNQVQKFWSPLFMQELRNSVLLPSLVNKDYQGQIQRGGDTVRVSQINAPTGQNLTVGTDADAFAPEALSTSYVDVQANKRAVASFEFEDLVQIESQIGQADSEIRKALVYAVGKKISDYLYGLVAPSTSAPDHLLNSVANLDATALLTMRKLASAAKWEKSKGWWVLCDPAYMNDLLGAQTMTSRDYVEGETPVVGGQIVNKRFGFSILEDNGLSTSQALAFHPDFVHLVMATEVNFKISDLHANKKFGYVISADLIYGATLGIDGSKKHVLSTASSSATGIVLA